MLVGFIVLVVVSVVLLSIGFSLFFSLDPMTIQNKSLFTRVFLWVMTIALGSIGLSIAVIGIIVRLIFILIGWV